MATAFQTNAFQSNSFLIDAAAVATKILTLASTIQNAVEMASAIGTDTVTLGSGIGAGVERLASTIIADATASFRSTIQGGSILSDGTISTGI